MRSLIQLIDLEELGFKSDKYKDSQDPLKMELEKHSKALSFVDMSHEQQLEMLRSLDEEKQKRDAYALELAGRGFTKHEDPNPTPVRKHMTESESDEERKRSKEREERGSID